MERPGCWCCSILLQDEISRAGPQGALRHLTCASRLEAAWVAFLRPWLLTSAVCDAYGKSPSVLRRNSRLIVDGDRPRTRVVSRLLQPCCLMLAIVIRSSG